MVDYVEGFDDVEMLDAARRMNKLVKELQGRKLEEDDWTKVYCDVKGAPYPGWSNLSFRDYVHQGIGVEFKLLKRKDPAADIGSWLMHPAATRKIDFDENDDPDAAMAKVFSDWNASIDEFEARVKATSNAGSADLRWGVMLWTADHSEFLYFEEKLIKPDPTDFIAKWHDGQHRGKTTRNLHIFDRQNPTIKRFSCTLPRNGAKLQPYFRIPSVAEGAHVFQPEKHDTVPVFIGKKDMDRLQQLFPNLDADNAIAQLLDHEEAHRS